ncbi:hypothetical protein AB0M44_00435 [Streptosporangium subroseum]|uniref:hypothetical protein n=1 Tax=Streptosporangium subroseum TaxID=106412 RepID=UPI003436B3AB
MLRRYRFGVPALLIVSVYVLAVAVAAVITLTVGDLGALWRLTLFTEVDEDTSATWPNVLVLVLAGTVPVWTLWQSLRGPLAGPAPELDRDTRRLRVALYAAVASWLLYFLLPSWHWWTALDAVAMWVVVIAFQPVLSRDLTHAGRMRIVAVPAYEGTAGPEPGVLRNLKHTHRMRAAGVVAYGGTAVLEVLDVLDRPVPDGLSSICGLAALIWTVMVLWAQWRDGRWQRATVWYGVASLLVPVAFMPVGLALVSEGNVYGDAMTATQTLMMIWLARSAHDLADPRHRPASPSLLPAQSQG